MGILYKDSRFLFNGEHHSHEFSPWQESRLTISNFRTNHISLKWTIERTIPSWCHQTHGWKIIIPQNSWKMPTFSHDFPMIFPDNSISATEVAVDPRHVAPRGSWLWCVSMCRTSKRKAFVGYLRWLRLRIYLILILDDFIMIIYDLIYIYRYIDNTSDILEIIDDESDLTQMAIPDG